jgi:GrpB-like predicted nucleotidyltransferase (UPF0157 family)
MTRRAALAAGLIVRCLPFADEAHIVELVATRSDWPASFQTLARRLAAAFGDTAVGIDHIGSTAVPGLPAKDVIDIQVRVRTLDEVAINRAFQSIGFRRRPEPWNQTETIGHEQFRKAVFAPPPGERAANIHVRLNGAPNARYALLFRDFLSADDTARASWAAFKTQTAELLPELSAYGRIKAAAMPILMHGAERWASERNWQPTRHFANLR